jgi:hypothetical protein
MKTTHTPGPWEVKRNDGIFHPLKNMWIATAHVQNTQQEQDANTHLIAAAPELLEALQLCAEVLHPGAVGLISAKHGSEAGERAVNAVYLLRAAIAKATEAT